MPNYVKHRLSTSSRFEEVLEFIKGEDTLFDFNKIVQMPECLNIESSSLGDLGMEYLLSKQNCLNARKTKELEQRIENLYKEGYKEEDIIGLGKKYLYNISITGYKTWYEWTYVNWRTKWNAVEPEVKGNYLEFETAWSGIEELIKKLSIKFPDVIFIYKYADEDTGCNCAEGTICNGISNMIYPESQSKQAYELAFELRPEYRDYYEFKNGKYICKEEE